MSIADGKTATVLLLIATVYCSSLAGAFAPVGPHIIYLVTCLVFILVRARRMYVHPIVAPAIIAMVFTSLIFAIHWDFLDATLSHIYLIFAAVAACGLDERIMDRFTTYLTYLLALVLGGAWVGFLYAAVGLPPLLDFLNPDGRPAYLYLGTATNAVLGNLIRPSGIFDEPGTLSFFICMTVALRHLRGQDSRMSIALLIAGMVTQSLAHAVFTALYFLGLSGRARRFAVGALLALVLAFAVSSDLRELFSDFFLNRFAIVDGRLVGDSRTEVMLNAWHLLENGVTDLFWGIDPACFAAGRACMADYGSFGENPLSLLALNGIMVGWPYYAVLVILASFSFRLRHGRLIPLAVMALLFQRPNVLGFGYALLTVIILWQLARVTLLNRRYMAFRRTSDRDYAQTRSSF